jgi:hypothetical protein
MKKIFSILFLLIALNTFSQRIGTSGGAASTGTFAETSKIISTDFNLAASADASVQAVCEQDYCLYSTHTITPSQFSLNDVINIKILFEINNAGEDIQIGVVAYTSNNFTAAINSGTMILSEASLGHPEESNGLFQKDVTMLYLTAGSVLEVNSGSFGEFTFTGTTYLFIVGFIGENVNNVIRQRYSIITKNQP